MDRWISGPMPASPQPVIQTHAAEGPSEPKTQTSGAFLPMQASQRSPKKNKKQRPIHSTISRLAWLKMKRDLERKGNIKAKRKLNLGLRKKLRKKSKKCADSGTSSSSEYSTDSRDDYTPYNSTTDNWETESSSDVENINWTQFIDRMCKQPIVDPSNCTINKE